MLDILLTTLFDIINTNHDYKTGNVDIETFNDTKKRFVQALGEFIDLRVREQLLNKRTSLSQERLAAANSINSTIKSTASTIKSLHALSSAPKPAENDPEFIEKYEEWYNNNRKTGMDIG